MKAVIISLKKEERKVLEGTVNNLNAGKAMLLEGAKLYRESEKRMWDKLNALYPQKEESDRSFNTEDYEIRCWVATTKQEKYKMLKEKAIIDKDFEGAAKYRVLERKEQN